MNNPAPRDTLNPIQQLVIKRLCQGATVKEIADEDGLSPKTIEYHRDLAKKALNIYDMSLLTHWARAVGLVKPMFKQLTDEVITAEELKVLIAEYVKQVNQRNGKQMAKVRPEVKQVPKLFSEVKASESFEREPYCETCKLTHAKHFVCHIPVMSDKERMEQEMNEAKLKNNKTGFVFTPLAERLLGSV